MKKLITLAFLFLFFTTVHAQESNTEYGENLLSIRPYVGYATPQISDLGIGISYKRFLNDFMSATVPFTYGLGSNMIQTGVGLKLYPTGHDRTVKYAIGPTLLFSRSSQGFEVFRQDTINNFTFSEEIDNPLTQIGFMLTNSLNVTVQKKIYLGAELGLGLNYLNHYKTREVDGVQIVRDGGANVLFMFSLSMGYRF
jgi:hypothetical protein